jgi:starvation-inducible DNA-binding protein
MSEWCGLRTSRGEGVTQRAMWSESKRSDGKTEEDFHPSALHQILPRHVGVGAYDRNMQMNIGIETKDRKDIVEGLSKVLADTYTLYLETHRYHWNVTGRMFQTLHDMFEVQYRDMWDAVDDLAERIRTLGSSAPGTYKQFAELTAIEPSEEVPPAMDMVANLVKGHETVVRRTREVLEAAEKSHDQGTADLLTARMQVHEKTAWMLRSLTQD